MGFQIQPYVSLSEGIKLEIALFGSLAMSLGI